MFILLRWSIRIKFSTIGEGAFQCGRCQSTQPFTHRTGKRWLHLVGLPLFPVSGQCSEHVRCETCKSKFTPAVLGQVVAAQPSV